MVLALGDTLGHDETLRITIYFMRHPPELNDVQAIARCLRRKVSAAETSTSAAMMKNPTHTVEKLSKGEVWIS